MIFVTVGTSTFPFDRLMHWVDELGADDELVIQYGASRFIPTTGLTTQFMSYSDVVENMQRAQVVIAHGGVGSILTAFHAGKRPVVVTRQRQYGEAVDDHQVDLARRLARQGVVILADDPAALGSLIATAPASLELAETSSALADALGEFVESALGVVPR